jgi:drug/metabolite transporter (DMT)-like permease
LKEKITLQKVFGIGLGATGAILLTLAGGASKGDSMLGDFFLFINATSYAVYLVIAKPLMQKYKPLTVITYTFTFGAIFILCFPPTLPELFATDFSTLTTSIIVKIVYVIIGVTFLTYLLTMYGLKYLSPSISSSYIYLQPVLVMLFAVLFSVLGVADDYTNTITLNKVIYMLLIFIGVYIISKKRKPTT